MQNNLSKLFVNFLIKYTWYICGIIFAISTIFCICISLLNFNSDFSSLLPEDNSKREEFQKILKEYSSTSNIYLLVEGDENDIKKFADFIIPRIEAFDNWVKTVNAQLPEVFFENQRLKLLTNSELNNFADLFHDPNLIPFLHNLNESFKAEYLSDLLANSTFQKQRTYEFLDKIEVFVEVLQKLFAGENPKILAESAVKSLLIGETYWVSPEQNMLLIVINPKFNLTDDKHQIIRSINNIDAVVQEAASNFSVQAGLTGNFVLSRDEVQAAAQKIPLSIVISALLIFILFVLFYRIWSGILLLVFSVILSIIWSLGITSFLIDSLTIITSMTCVIWIGLGVFWGVPVIAVYSEYRHTGLSVGTAMEKSILKNVPGIFAGGLIISLAFLSIITAKSQGLTEFGLVAGLGTIILLVSMLIILPTFLITRERIFKKLNNSEIKPLKTSRLFGQTAEFIANHKVVFSFFICVLTIFFLFYGGKVKIDNNYLNLKPNGMPAIQLQNKLIKNFGIATDNVILMSGDLEMVRELTSKARQLSTVGRVESITDYLLDTENESEIFHFIRSIRRNLNSVKIQPKLTEIDIQECCNVLKQLSENINAFQNLVAIRGYQTLYQKTTKLIGVCSDTTRSNRITQLLEAVIAKDNLYKLSDFHRHFADIFREKLLVMAHFSPLTVADLPVEIFKRFVGRSGNDFLITIYPKNSVWDDTNNRKKFVSEIESLSQEATGFPLIFVDLVEVFRKDAIQSILPMLIIAITGLLLYFRSFKYSLAAFLPVVVNIIWLIGIMRLFDLQYTFADTFAVYFIAEANLLTNILLLKMIQLSENGGFHFSYFGKAVLMSSLIVMLGFGSFSFTPYTILGILGSTIMIGIASGLTVSLIIIPLIIPKAKIC